jgi:hypothetical protein
MKVARTVFSLVGPNAGKMPSDGAERTCDRTVSAVRSGRGRQEENCTKVKGRKRAKKIVRLRWCMAVAEFW